MENSSFFSVIKNPGFLNLWVNQILVQLSYNCVNFALIIWVYQLTHSNLAVSILLFSVYLPAVIFGLFSGVVVDLIDKKKVIFLINICMGVLFLTLIPLKSNYTAIIFLTFLINTLAQFYAPAESSAIPFIVKKDQLLAANSLFSITFFSSFLIGFGLSGPLIESYSINFVFAVGGVILLIASFLSLLIPSIITRVDRQGKKLLDAFEKKNLKLVKQMAFSEIRETLHLVKGKLSLLSAIFILAGVQVVVGILAVLIPSFLERELNINATNASYVLVIPLGLGMVAGGYIIGRFGNLIARRILIGRAIMGSGMLFFSAGIAPFISPVIKYFPKRPTHFSYQLPLSTIMATGSLLLGICMISIMVPSQTVLQENTPEEDRGKVFAVLSMAMSGLSLIPVLFAGIFADVFGVLPIFLSMGAVILLIGIFILNPAFFFSEKHLPENVRVFLGTEHWKRKNQDTITKMQT